MNSKAMLAGAAVLGAVAGAALFAFQTDEASEPPLQAAAAASPELTIYKSPT